MSFLNRHLSIVNWESSINLLRKIFLAIFLEKVSRKHEHSITRHLILDVNLECLASPDALEVIVVTDSLTDLLSVSTDLTDVTLVSDDTY